MYISYIYIYLFVYIYPQAAWFAVRVNPHFGPCSLVLFFFGGRGFWGVSGGGAHKSVLFPAFFHVFGVSCFYTCVFLRFT